MKVAVVTPYYKENDEVLRRCCSSVARQTYPATHFVVADGFPRQNAFDGFPIRHSSLPFAHRDFGNTPRTVGALSALNQGFDAIALLDADNWYEPNHIESLVSALKRAGAHVAASYRNFYLPDGTFVDVEDAEDMAHSHIDTSSFVFTKNAAHIFPLWGMMEPSVAPFCDRVVFWALQSLNVSIAWSGMKTLNYNAHYAPYYVAANRKPPPDVHDVDYSAALGNFNARNHFYRTRTKANFLSTP